MDPDFRRTLLISEITAFYDSLRASGIEPPDLPSRLEDVTTIDLQALKKELRDLLRTLGGSRA